MLQYQLISETVTSVTSSTACETIIVEGSDVSQILKCKSASRCLFPAITVEWGLLNIG